MTRNILVVRALTLLDIVNTLGDVSACNLKVANRNHAIEHREIKAREYMRSELKKAQESNAETQLHEFTRKHVLIQLSRSIKEASDVWDMIIDSNDKARRVNEAGEELRDEVFIETGMLEDLRMEMRGA